jgi:hypothetical protein
MRTLLARAGLMPRADYRAVFHTFAESLARVLARRNGRARVRAVGG